jgi:hypothetical protein
MTERGLLLIMRPNVQSGTLSHRVGHAPVGRRRRAEVKIGGVAMPVRDSEERLPRPGMGFLP